MYTATSQLVTRSTRHKEAVNSSQTYKQTTKPYCPTSIITLTHIVRDHRRYEKNAQEIEQKPK